MEPQPPVPDRVPYAPRALSEEAQKEWRRLVPILLDLGLYTEVDRQALVRYCQAWGDWVVARRRLDETGGPVLRSESTGNLYQNPWYHVANRAWDQLEKAGGAFGMTPSSRTRVTAVTDAEPDPFAEFLQELE